jgi:RNA polymerase sigma factor (sigma-70 family)
MSHTPLRAVVRHLRRLTGRPDAGVPDAQLLQRFVAERDEAAFELLLWRHGPMVRGVCRRVLRHHQDAEDAFQATFLILVRKAGSISRRESLAGWLYRVAYRVALRARDAAARQPQSLPLNGETVAPEPDSDLVWRDLRPVLDEEVDRLPPRYRLPLILCYFEGKTHEQAARELGCPKGTIDVRLMRARERLRDRLARRGLSLSAGTLATALTEQAASATVPAALTNAALQAALTGAAGGGTAGAVAAPVAALTEGVLRSMTLAKLKMSAAGLLLITCLFGAGSAALLSSRAGPAGEATPPAGRDDENPRTVVNIPSERAGKLVFIATEMKPGEVVPADRRVEVNVSFLAVELDKGEEPKEPALEIEGKQYRRWKPEDKLVPGKVRVAREKRALRRLRVGDSVEEGQLLALVNPVFAVDELAAKVAKLDVSEAEVKVAIKTKLEAEKRYDAAAYAFSKNAISADDYRATKLAWDRAIEEEVAKRATVLQVQAELNAALTVLSMHEIRSPVPGVIKKILKHPGEATRDLETVFEVQTEGQTNEKPARRPPRVEVPSERDGKLMFLATEIKPGEKVPTERTIEVTIAFLTIEVGKDEQANEPIVVIGEKKYRRWKPTDPLTPERLKVARVKKTVRKFRMGDAVEEGQLLGLVNPTLAIDELAARIAKLDAAEAALRAAVKTKVEAEKRFEYAEKAHKVSAISADDYRAAQLSWERYIEEEVVKRAAVRQAQIEVNTANTVLQMCEIRSSVRGTICGLAKRAGEGVRNLETVVQIEVVDKPPE